MSTSEAGPVTAEAVDDDPRRSKLPWALAATAVVVLCAGLGAWWLGTPPRLEGGGTEGVASADHEVVHASGSDEDVYVVPADVPGSSTIAFGIRNTGTRSVELVDVWPSMERPHCFWQPSERWIQDDPQYTGVLDDRARPVAGAVLAPGAAATVWVTGAHPDPDGCVHENLTFIDEVEVIARIGGRTSTMRVPLGFTFGYTDDLDLVPDLFDPDDFDVQVLPPTTPGG